MMPRAILFDLDGTLVDTRAASWELFSETNLAFDLGIDSREAFFRGFEGNFFDSLAKWCPDAGQATAVKAHFMELLRTRYHPALIPGMVDVVRALAPHCTLAVISTNGIEAIRRILVDAGIATCFSHVFSGDVEPRKATSMRRFLGDQRYAAQRMCTPAYHDGDVGSAFDASEVVLVTDTVGDIAEAIEAGVRAVGVSWGMHSEAQLIHAGAERVALWPQELVAWLGSGRAAQACGSACASSPSTACDACAVSQAPPVVRSARGPSTPQLPSATPAVHGASTRRDHQLQCRTAVCALLANGSSAVVDGNKFLSNKSHAELMHALARTVGKPWP